MYQASLSSGRATASQLDAVVKPRVRQSHQGGVYLHGSGSSAAEAVGSITPAVAPILAKLASAGWPIGAPTAPHTWGNTTGRSRLSDVATWLRASHDVTNDALVLVGVSHGSVWAFDFAIANPGLVAGVIAILPIVDLTAVRNDNVMGVRASIDTAWGVSYPAALPAGADPSLNTEALAEVPMQLWYATDDPLSVGVEDFADDTGADLQSIGALGHTNAAVSAVSSSQIVDFVNNIE